MHPKIFCAGSTKKLVAKYKKPVTTTSIYEKKNNK